MKKLLLLFVVAATVLSACKKGTVLQTEAQVEEAQIQAYIKNNGLTNVEKDPRGVYYQVITPGTGTVTPDTTSSVKVNYTGTLLDGTQFDKQSGYGISLSQAVKGWQYGLQHITVGGRIKLIVPSALGYGHYAQSSIPANSVLIFVIDLSGLQQQL